MKLTGNSGIGLATARLLAAEGEQVAITGRDQKPLDEAIAELGSSARGYRADVTIAEDRERLFSGKGFSSDPADRYIPPIVDF